MVISNNTPLELPRRARIDLAVVTASRSKSRLPRATIERRPTVLPPLAGRYCGAERRSA